MKMSKYEEFTEFTPMQVKKYLSSCFIIIYFLWKKCDTFETAIMKLKVELFNIETWHFQEF